MNILTLNAGSNSLKFEIIVANPDDPGFGSISISGSYDDIGKSESSFALLKNKRPLHQDRISVRDHGHATELLFQWIEHGEARNAGVRKLSDIDRVGHRVVHGGDFFDGPALITDTVIKRIQNLEDLAPLHNVSALKAIHATRSQSDLKAPMVAVFDTVFHRTIPDEAALYPIPRSLSERHRIRRYGFHGISHRYLTTRYAQLTKRPVNEINLVTLHLEGGSSAAAIRRGESVDTSMGFTPLEGLMMGTRCGDIDPALVTYLMRKEKMDAHEVETFLNKKCGLLGVSGRSADTRELAKHMNDESSRLAIDMFCYRVRKYIGAYLAVPGETEAVVLGGGIGENMPAFRERIFNDFHLCGTVFDRLRNESVVDCEGPISAEDSQLGIWVIPTQEGLMMAKDVAAFDISR